eukprot:5269884-Amphidinium_carterae.3
MVLVARGMVLAGHFCYGYWQVQRNLTEANKTVVIGNGATAKRLLMKVWRAGRLQPVKVTTRDLGVDT